MKMTEEGKRFVMKSEWMWAWKKNLLTAKALACVARCVGKGEKGSQVSEWFTPNTGLEGLGLHISIWVREVWANC